MAVEEMTPERFMTEVQKRMEKMMDREINREVRHAVESSVRQDKHFSIMTGGITVNGAREGLVFYKDGEPIFGFCNPEESSVMADLILSWTMAQCGLKVMSEHHIEHVVDEMEKGL